jgi:hypothetical protein
MKPTLTRRNPRRCGLFLFEDKMELQNGKLYEVFRAGKWNGNTWTEDDLQAMADTYDPNHREATIGIGHVGVFQSEQPRHGAVASLIHAGGRLYASFKDLSEELIDSVKAGLYADKSCEIIPARWSETKQPYFSGLAFLGRSQPAVPGMHRHAVAGGNDTYRFTVDTNEFIENENLNLTKGDNDMDEKEVRQLMADAIAPFAARIGELEKRPDITAEEFAAVKEKVAQFDALNAANDDLQAKYADQCKVNAETEVAALLTGIPKVFSTEETRNLLITLAQTDRKAFAAASAPFKPMKDRFAYLGRELVPEGGEVSEHSSEPVSEKADPVTVALDTRAHAIMVENKWDVNNHKQYAQALSLAMKEGV